MIVEFFLMGHLNSLNAKTYALAGRVESTKHAYLKKLNSLIIRQVCPTVPYKRSKLYQNVGERERGILLRTVKSRIFFCGLEGNGNWLCHVIPANNVVRG